MQGRRTILEERQKFFTNTWERSRKRFTDSVCEAPLHRAVSKYHRLSHYPT